MAVERAILCGNVREGGVPFDVRRPLRLRMWGPGANVHLTIEDIRRRMYRDVPAQFLDLIDLAVFVYCADQVVPRGSEADVEFGPDWRRKLFFRVPVRSPDLWNDDRVRTELVSTLAFLSEDEYHFEF